jgi:hypothetical protein
MERESQADFRKGGVPGGGRCRRWIASRSPALCFRVHVVDSARCAAKRNGRFDHGTRVRSAGGVAWFLAAPLRRMQPGRPEIGALRAHQCCVGGAVALDHDGGGAPDAEIGHWLLDHLVGAGEERGRHLDPERFRGVQVDAQLELGRLVDGDLGRLRTS